MTILPIKQLRGPLDHSYENAYGETPLPFAPEVTLANGQNLVPQQYLDVHRTRANVEAIVNQITFRDDYPLFVDQVDNTVVLQVGLIGEENYPGDASQCGQPKIVYGRRWLIEPTTPTSEVVQTAMLAIKKAREHELREKMVLQLQDSDATATPFNSHLDLPVMAAHAELFREPQPQQSFEQQLEGLLPRILVDGMTLELRSVDTLASATVVEIETRATSKTTRAFPELLNRQLLTVLQTASAGELLHALMSALVHSSDRYVEENFMFAGFARFSRTHSPEAMAQFSIDTRKITYQDERFDGYFRSMSRTVDYGKAPFYSGGELGDKQRALVDKFADLGGYLPKQRRSQQQMRCPKNQTA